MTATITVITQGLIEAYIDGRLSAEDGALIEAAADADERAADALDEARAARTDARTEPGSN